MRSRVLPSLACLPVLVSASCPGLPTLDVDLDGLAVPVRVYVDPRDVYHVYAEEDAWAGPRRADGRLRLGAGRRRRPAQRPAAPLWLTGDHQVVRMREPEVLRAAKREAFSADD